jgi:hypothetical protein
LIAGIAVACSASIKFNSDIEGSSRSGCFVTTVAVVAKPTIVIVLRSLLRDDYFDYG